MAVLTCTPAPLQWPDLPQVNVGSQHGKTTLNPPAGCVFICHTRIGDTETLGTAPAAGLLGADKYGQDKSLVGLQTQWPFNGTHASCASVPRSLGVAHMPRVPDTAVEHIRQIGAGAFGKVVLGRLPGEELVAIKLAAEGKEAILAHEACTHALFNHANIVSLRAVVVTTTGGGVAGLAMDYCSGGTLAAWLEWNRAHGGPPLPLLQRLQVIEQLLAALEHMHSCGVCHLDIKPCNIMLSAADLCQPQLIRLADFGLSQPCDGTQMAGRYRGTLPYMAPEFARNVRSAASPAMDVWSLGVLMRELVSAEPPCSSWQSNAIKAGLRSGSLYAEPLPCEPEWKALMHCCLQYDASARPSVKEVRVHVRELIMREGLQTGQFRPAPFVAPLCGRRSSGGGQQQLDLPDSLGLGVVEKCGDFARCGEHVKPTARVGAGSLNLPESLGLTSF